MSVLTADIVSDFIAQLDLSGTVDAVSTSGGNTLVTLENAYHLREEMSVSIEGTDYDVLSIDTVNQVITIAGIQAISVNDSYNVANPFYFHGTPIATNENIVELDDPEKVPMVYLYELLRERIYSKLSSLDRTAQVTLFLLDNANFEDWTTDDHYSKRLLGLYRLKEKIVTELQNYTRFYQTDEVIDVAIYTKFGLFRTMQGMVSKIFDDDLTGIELKFNLNIRKSC